MLEWGIAKLTQVQAEQVISFSSATIPLMAILRTNLLSNKNTIITYVDALPNGFDADAVKTIYGYEFTLKKVSGIEDIPAFDGSTIFISEKERIGNFDQNVKIDFLINTNAKLGSVLLINGQHNEAYVSEIQHVRRRETIAMTPSNTVIALNSLLGKSLTSNLKNNRQTNKTSVLNAIEDITNTKVKALLGSSGLSVQYAIVMGLIDDALQNHQGKAIKIIVPPNCYGGTNDQARRVAAVNSQIEVLDLPVDGGKDMVDGVEAVLEQAAHEDAVPFIIAEIPTNPRVEVPDLVKLKEALGKERHTANGQVAISPVFILDQTFCPNVHFLGQDNILSSVKTIAYVSGSKFPSGGKCTAGYCVANRQAAYLMPKIEKHLKICDNEATDHQLEILAEQLPSMNDRINGAYKNTRDFVNFITTHLPSAKINFVSEALAEQGFTPSVFSLDLPTKGQSDEERETYKRALNLKLINLMIEEIPHESKYCVSYGQLKGCYWTIPATSTQGTTKEGDKDYIVRVALSAQMDLEHHKKVFLDFLKNI